MATLVAAACSSGAVPGVGGEALPPAPPLQGATVMVVPVQHVRGIRGDVDAEIAFALRERARRTDWVFPPELRRALDRTPGFRIRLDALATDIFRGREVRRIGDPLYGQLRQLGALADADLALIPVEAGVRLPSEEVEGDPATTQIAAALVELRGGRVLWFGVVEAPREDGGERRSLAEAAEALARALRPGEEPGDERKGAEGAPEGRLPEAGGGPAPAEELSRPEAPVERGP